MTQLGISVPAGFVVSTEVCKAYHDHEGQLPDEFWLEFNDHLNLLEGQTAKQFGSGTEPLLVSVRSGAPVSMPGMMDTVLNVGLNDESVEALARSSGNRHFAYDSYRRLLQMYGEVVAGIDKQAFDYELNEAMVRSQITNPADLSAEALEELVEIFKDVMIQESDELFL